MKLLEQLNANAHSQAQWQVAQANAKAKTYHRACLFPNADFADTKKTKSFKNSENCMTELKNYLKPLTDKNAQLVTCGIFYCRESAEINGCGSLQTSSWFDSVVLRTAKPSRTPFKTN